MTRKPFHGLGRRLKALILKIVPGMITCREFDAFVVDYLDGRLPAAQRDLFERHLGVCADCRRFLDNYRATLEAEKIAFTDEEPGLEEVPEALIQAVLAARKRGDAKKGGTSP